MIMDPYPDYNALRAHHRPGEDFVFSARISSEPGLRGASPDNICNRFTARGGVQLELTRGLREAMFDHLDNRSWRGKTPVFYRFVKAVRKPLLELLFQAKGGTP